MKESKLENRNLPKIWLAFVLVRFLWTFIGQRGYLHPDEYFQSLEIVTSELFDTPAYRTWEFEVTNTTKPIRNIAIPYLVYGLPLILLKILSQIGLFSITTSNLIFFPRLVQTFLSLLGDYFIYKIARLLKLNENNCLILYSSSYITLIYLTHTFSNSIEAILFTILLYYTVNTIKCLENNQNTDLNVSIIGLVTCIGVFNRPTFIIYCFIPICYLAYRYKSLIKYAILLLNCSVITAVGLVIIDTFYYTSTLELENLIVAPLNFFLYNINQENLALHGAHPVFQHVLVNCFLLYGLQYLKFYKNFKRDFLCSTLIFVLTVFSLVAHKEARFLLPLLVIICLVTSTDTSFSLWYLFNFVLALIYGVYHQGALVESLDFVTNMFKHEANAAISQHVFYYQTYMPPRYLVNVQLGKQASNQNQIFDMMSSVDYNQVENFLEQTYTNISTIEPKRNMAFFIVTPAINDDLLCNSKRVKFHLFYQFYFNIQFENLNNYLNMLLCEQETCNYKCNQMNYLERIFYTFTLNLYQFVV